MHENPFKLFDSILTHLADNYGKSETLKNLSDQAYPKSQNEPNEYADKITYNSKKPNLISDALFYLKSEDLVYYSLTNDQIPLIMDIRITPKGFVKIKTNSFREEYRKAYLNHIFNTYLTFLIALGALIFSIWSYYNPYKPL
ncbi:hypothetical protein [uncultured Flavobacterium sp.]|uniref:hypothetical protein n=1 Tax=uncultured Flavobacterium sp. TaxID=165435 RepID=UPI00292EF71D|nr:hypothetical protein [uncultured Flavobacterium sp.]